MLEQLVLSRVLEHRGIVSGLITGSNKRTEQKVCPAGHQHYGSNICGERLAPRQTDLLWFKLQKRATQRVHMSAKACKNKSMGKSGLIFFLNLECDPDHSQNLIRCKFVGVFFTLCFFNLYVTN